MNTHKEHYKVIMRKESKGIDFSGLGKLGHKSNLEQNNLFPPYFFFAEVTGKILVNIYQS